MDIEDEDVEVKTHPQIHSQEHMQAEENNEDSTDKNKRNKKGNKNNTPLVKSTSKNF